MGKRSSIFSARGDGEVIGYIEAPRRSTFQANGVAATMDKQAIFAIS